MDARQRLEALSAIISERDVITTDGYLRACGNDTAAVYWKRDFLFRHGDWRGQAVRPLILSPSVFRGRTLVVGHGDDPLGHAAQAPFRVLGAARLAGVNLTPWNRFSFTLPLGLTNDCDDSPLHRVFGNLEHLDQALTPSRDPYEYHGSVLACFTVDTAPRFRSDLRAMAQEAPGMAWVDPVPTEQGRVAFLTAVQEHDFVLCPRGNGLDTHRLWETLYMGGIPVLRRTEFEPSLVTGLPVLIVREWTELLDGRRRREAWESVVGGTYDIERLRLSHWTASLAASEAA